MALSKDQIARRAGIFKIDEVHVPTWKDDNGDDVVLVRSLGLTEGLEWQNRATNNAKSGAELLVKCIVDERGHRLFSDNDLDLVGALPLAEATDLTDKILKLSGMAPDEQEQIEGNSEAAPSGSSPSDSPETSDEPSPS